MTLLSKIQLKLLSLSISLRSKLMGAFVIIALLVAVTSGLSYYFMKKMNLSYGYLLNHNAMILQLVSEIQYQAQLQYSLMSGYIIDPSPEKGQAIVESQSEAFSFGERRQGR